MRKISEEANVAELLRQRRERICADALVHVALMLKHGKDVLIDGVGWTHDVLAETVGLKVEEVADRYNPPWLDHVLAALQEHAMPALEAESEEDEYARALLTALTTLQKQDYLS